MNKIFRRFLKSRTQGDEEKELYWWDIFYRYEVSIGAAISVIPCLIAAIIIIPMLYLSNDAKDVIYSVIFSIGVSVMIGLAVAWFIVSPLNETVGDKTVRKEDLGQGSLLFATGLGHITNLFINWGPVLILCINLVRFRWNSFIMLAIVIIGYYMLLGIVKANAKDYVNWRFNWAIENYETLFSGHYKWWTSVNDMSVQKIHLKRFQNYKYHATLAIIMIPLLMTPLISMISVYSHTNNSVKTEQIQATTDSISTPDVVENNAISNPEEVIENQDNEQSAIMSENEDTYSEASTSTGDENSIQFVVVMGVNVRLRTSPEINDYNIIKDSSGKNLHPNKGERLQCVSEEGDFYLVNFRGNNVYISKQFAVLQ